jgi:NodT family efflux transporter outer membrane factor (OMF) lipoprotein
MTHLHERHNSPTRRAVAYLSAPLCLSLSLALSACMIGPKYQRPAATTQAPPANYKESPENHADSDWKVAQPGDAMLRGKWWEIFNQPELNDLEDQLNIDNQNIKVYFENYMEARDIVREAHAQLYPTVSAAPAFTRSRSSANLGNNTGVAKSSGATASQSTLAQLPLEVSWEPDIWGKIRNTIRSDQYQAQVSEADLENEKLTEQASLAEYYFQLRGQDAIQKIYNDLVDADRKALDVTKASYDNGIDDQISVVQAQETLDSAKAAAINVGIARAQYEHAIAVLIGKSASSFSIPVKPLTSAPPSLPIGMPSQLLERRPDIAAAERTMASANAQIGVAKAAYYPNVTLTAEGGFESSTLQHLLSWPSRFWSIGGTASETIFDAGLRRATVNQYVAVYNADLASYRQTVLTAFQQVEDYLASVRILSDQIKQQQAAVSSAQKYVDLETDRYKNGIDPYVDVLTAQTTLLSDTQVVASLQVQQMTSSVALIEALGGGWDRTQLPTPAQVSQLPDRASTVIQK